MTAGTTRRSFSTTLKLYSSILMRISRETNLTPSACGGRLGRGLGRYSSTFSSRNLFQWPRSSSRPLLGLRRALPVVDHLCRQDNVQDKPSNESIQNELVVNFLQRSKDPRKGTDEVVEYLSSQLRILNISRQKTYRKGTQLSGSSLAPDRVDLRRLTSHTERTSTSL